MSASDWLQDSQNWVFVVLALAMLFTAWRVVTTKNVVHAVLYLVVTLTISAIFFLLLGAEFVAWVVVLVSIGAVVVLFLFGIMITRAPLGTEVELSHPSRVRIPAAIISFLLFIFVGGAMLAAFGDTGFESGVTRTADVGDSIFNRWVIPFEVVSVLLLAALIGGIVLARRDPPEMEAGTPDLDLASGDDPDAGTDDAEAAEPEEADARAEAASSEEPERAESTEAEKEAAPVGSGDTGAGA
jgi:NADH-quinone oxidoreductase subunit J